MAPQWGEVSDGYHTFNELYDHRAALTAALAKTMSLDAWRSKQHHPDDAAMLEGQFIVGLDLWSNGSFFGTVCYHYNLERWDDFQHVTELPHAPKWDGANSHENLSRVRAWAVSR